MFVKITKILPTSFYFHLHAQTKKQWMTTVQYRQGETQAYHQLGIRLHIPEWAGCYTSENSMFPE